MNVISLHQLKEQKQHQDSSWIDDPFDMKGVVIGENRVSHHKSNLDRHIHELVNGYAVYVADHYELTLDMLAEEEQSELLGLYIESIDREIEWACYGKDESINSNFLCEMLAMLKNNNKESRLKFAETIRKNLTEYYKNTINELLVIGCEFFLNAEMNEAGYRAEFDLEHGDVVWIR